MFIRDPLPKKNGREQFPSYFNLRKIEISYVQNCFNIRMVTIENIFQRRKISKLRARLELSGVGERTYGG